MNTKNKDALKEYKATLESKDLIAANVEKLAAIFPDIVTEGDSESGRKVDFEKLREILGDKVFEDREERYEFTWNGKNLAKAMAYSQTSISLIPDKASSVNWDTTQNLYIEGDNLEVLKQLQAAYYGKIKMIYIDPPYNTGNDFIYKDNFSASKETYDLQSNNKDELGNKFVVNQESSGRFHSDWCSMMYPRLVLARNLLSEDGVIFCSTGQSELDNTIKCFDDSFGNQNKIGIISRVMKSGGGKGQFFSPNIDYIVVYSKNIEKNIGFSKPLSDEIIKKLYTSIEKEGKRKGEKYRPFGLYQSSLDPLRGCTNQRYYIEAPDGSLLIPPGNSFPSEKKDGAMIVPQSKDDKVWRWSKERYLAEKRNGNIEFKKSNGVLLKSDGSPAEWNVYTKMWLADRQEKGVVPVDLISRYENRHSAKELSSLDIHFDFAKPTSLIKYLMQIQEVSNDYISLDFFSGSATTAHAVMQLNAEDGGNRKFIMVQLPEVCKKDSEAAKNGYKNICEIGKERIRRAGKKIIEEIEAKNNGDNQCLQKPDIGFRVFKVAESFIKPIHQTPAETTKKSLLDSVDNILARKPEELFWDTLIAMGIEPTLPVIKANGDKTQPHIHTDEVEGKQVFICHVGDRPELAACFDKNISLDVVKYMAELCPLRIVFRDSCFAIEDRLNAARIFTQLKEKTNNEIKICII